MRQNLIKSAIIVFGTWWLIIFVRALASSQAFDSELIESMIIAGTMSMLGIIIGFAVVYYILRINRESQIALLQSDNCNGLVCTIGEVPFIIKTPKQSRIDLDFKRAGEICSDIPDDFFLKWKEKYQKTHPQHVALMQELLNVFNFDTDLPATHMPGGHGNRSLLEHSLLVAYQMDQIGKTWVYEGLFTKDQKHCVLPLSDNDYKYNSEDPLAAIIGIGHDIGKIETFIRDDNGNISGIKKEHDMTGARMMARLDNIWEIPDADMRAITLAIAHYHHPMKFPLSPDRRATDDRTIALMELLIRADRVVSAIESKAGIAKDAQTMQELTGGYDSKKFDVLLKDLEDQKIWEYLIDALNEVGRINGTSTKHNLGCYCQVLGFNSNMLLLRDDSLRSLMMQKLGITYSEELAGGVHELNARIRAILHSKGVLITSFKGVAYNPDYAIWNFSFFSRKTKGGTLHQTAKWSAVNIVDVSKIYEVKNLKPYYWVAKVEQGVFGAARSLKKNVPAPGDYEGQSAEELEEGQDGVEPSIEGQASEHIVPVPVPAAPEAAAPAPEAAAPAPEAAAPAPEATDQTPELPVDMFEQLMGTATKRTKAEKQQPAVVSNEQPIEATAVQEHSAAAEMESEPASILAVDDDETELRRKYSANEIQTLVVDLCRSLLKKGYALKEHPAHGYVISSNTLLEHRPAVPWEKLNPIIRDYHQKGKLALEVHDDKSKKATFVLTVDKLII